MSPRDLDLPDLERDLPTTAEDVLVLRRLREPSTAPAAWWINDFDPSRESEESRARRHTATSAGWKPFSLVDDPPT